MAPLLTAADLAQALGLSAYTVLAHARAGRLPHVRIGHRVRFDPDLVARLIAEGYNARHVPTTEVEKAQERIDRTNVVGRVVRGRRRRKARASEHEPWTVREASDQIGKSLAGGTPESYAPFILDLDLPLSDLKGVVTTTTGALEPAKHSGDSGDD